MIARRSAAGWSVVVLIFVLGIVWDASELQAQSRPTFAPLDAGGVPSNLIELAPRALSKGEILPTGSYVIWNAIKKPGTSCFMIPETFDYIAALTRQTVFDQAILLFGDLHADSISQSIISVNTP